MTHGSADKDRQATIDRLMSANPDFCISKISGDYYLTAYNGLDNILKIIENGLVIAETTAKTLNEQVK